jgi:hypothetical protein
MRVYYKAHRVRVCIIVVAKYLPFYLQDKIFLEIRLMNTSCLPLIIPKLQMIHYVPVFVLISMVMLLCALERSWRRKRGEDGIGRSSL